MGVNTHQAVVNAMNKSLLYPLDHGYKSFYLLTQAWMSMLYTVLITSKELLLINI